MTILFDARRPVKTSRRFGSGLLAWTPTSRAPYPTHDDAAWWAAESARLENARLDRLAEEAAAIDRHERGLVA